MHPGDDIYLRSGVTYGLRTMGSLATHTPDVNEERRLRKSMGMTGKQYRKWKKKQNKEHFNADID